MKKGTYLLSNVYRRRYFIIALVLLLVTPAQSFALCTGPYTWVQKNVTISGVAGYGGMLLMTPDGTKFMSDIYRSNDGGDTWTEHPYPESGAGAEYVTAIAMSDDGMKVVFGETRWTVWNTYPAPIFTSTNNGSTWTQRISNNTWSGIGSSADGTRLVAVGDYQVSQSQVAGYIYTSTDSGVNWTQRTGAGFQNWVAVTSSSDGMRIAAVEASSDTYTGYIHTSTDGGATWTTRTSVGSRHWSDISGSSDGMKLVAVAGLAYAGYIYTSTDGGATWTARTSAGSRIWGSVRMSRDGNTIIATDANAFDGVGYIYISNDGGATWTQQSTIGTQYWGQVNVSSDGTKVAAVGDGVWIGTCVPPNQLPPAPTITGPNSGYINVANTYTFSGADDPDNDTIRYAIDWDSNGTVDAYAPSTGYSPDNSSETASYTWNTPGAKTFQARSEDSRGGVSGWTPYSVTIGDVPTVIVTASTTEYRGGDPVIGFTWSSSGAVSCTGTNLNTGGASSGYVTLTPTATTTYTVTCTSPGGSDADSITVNFTANQPPNTPTITGPTSGRTGSTYTYTVTGSDPDGDAVRFGVDFNGDDIVDSWTNW